MNGAIVHSELRQKYHRGLSECSKKMLRKTIDRHVPVQGPGDQTQPRHRRLSDLHPAPPGATAPMKMSS